ncbi:MAG: AAA family ATPase [Lachnospiraceae bacterium]|nr:AAA family ATPase [Lachnospiraceae bacterium]
MGVKIPLGVESFARMRENDYYYIDKTNFIKELLSKDFIANLITRPRRFGKSLTMSMLDDFFDISKESRAHFDGLAISKETEICEKWMNQYPVVFISFKDIDGNTFESAYGMMKAFVADMCKKYSFLMESNQLNAADKKIFIELQYQESTPENVKRSLLLLTRMLSAHYGKKTILLVDEYDVPLAKANANGYYKEMLEVIRAMLSTALKTNDDLEFGIVTGCLRISKESIFTGLNNLVINSITTDRFDEYIGFTEEEVQNLLKDTGFTDHAQEIRDWYDGYRFGQVDVYCPWDVLNHVAALMENSKTKPKSYWAGTSHNDVIYNLFSYKKYGMKGKFEALMRGESIQEVITEELTYDTLTADDKNLWSLLFMTGYLTQDKQMPIKDNVVTLRIPNEELKYVFKNAIIDWFERTVSKIDRSKMFEALWKQDADTAQAEISKLLLKSISYHDFKESFYHAFVAGMFAGADYPVESNYEYGDGRPDIVVNDGDNDRVMLFEVKHADKNETIEYALQEAIAQIEEKRYLEGIDEFETVVCYGIAFKGKKCIMQLYPTDK